MWPFSKPTLSVYNTLTRKVEPVRPHHNKTVSVYTCGPTVYDAPHIGNMRAYILADTLNRALRVVGYTPKHVINITDVGHLTNDSDDGDDKVEVAAKQSGMSAKSITEKNEALFIQDLERVGVPTDRYLFPRASDYIIPQIEIVKALEKKGYTYKTDDGIYFDTSRFPAYGNLSGQRADGKEAGARVGVGQKKHVTDFALWKLSQPTDARQQEWDSPWGRGFPGWHLECSAMAFALLGQEVDIHTGGMDHIPIHHENEIAQSEAVSGRPYVRTWIHGAFITINKERIAKSLGNGITLNDLALRGIDPMAYRLWILQGSYRTPMNFTWDAVGAAQTTLERLRRSISTSETTTGTADKKIVREATSYLVSNLDTPKLVALFIDVAGRADMNPSVHQATLRVLDTMLGLNLFAPTTPSQPTIPDNVQAWVTEREAARQEKRFADADSLRDQIEGAGYRVADTESGPFVTKV